MTTSSRGIQQLSHKTCNLTRATTSQAIGCRWFGSQGAFPERRPKRKPNQQPQQHGGSSSQRASVPTHEMDHQKYRTSIFFNGSPVYPSESARSFARQHEISLAGAPRGIAIRYPLDMARLPLSVMASREHVFNDIHWKYLDYTHHPFSETMLDHYARKKREEPLWVWVLIPPSSAVPYVRSRAKTRLVGALTLALAQRGYDAVGARVVPGVVTKFQKRWCVDDKGEPIVAKGPPQLKGTIKLHCKASPIIHTSFDDVLRQMNVVVTQLEDFLGGGGGRGYAADNDMGSGGRWRRENSSGWGNRDRDNGGRSGGGGWDSRNSDRSRDVRDGRRRADKPKKEDDTNSGGGGGDKNWVRRGQRDDGP